MSLDDSLWDLLSAVHLDDFFNDHNLPAILFPILIIAIIGLAAFFIINQPISDSALTCGDGLCAAGEDCPEDCGGSEVVDTDVTINLDTNTPPGDYRVELKDNNGNTIADTVAAPGDSVTFHDVPEDSVTATITDPAGESWNSHTIDLTGDDNTPGGSGSSGGSGGSGSAIPECTSNGQCNDNNICTTDSCSAGQCSFQPNTASCDDNKFCIINDHCSAGSCRGSPKDCSDTDPSTTDTCSEPTDTCLHSTTPECSQASDCDDDNPCTDDTCPSGSCVFTNNNSNICSDGMYCTQGDACIAGDCNGTARNCGSQICSESTDSCVDDTTLECETASDCDDQNPCTNNACSSGSCVFTPNTASCIDNLFCTTNEVCSGGMCIGTALSCDDSNPATTDSCSEPTDTCIHSTTPECTQASQCDDQNPCTDNTCPSGSCVFTNDNTNACTDAFFCTINDHCYLGSCFGDNNPCDDSLSNTIDSCSENTDTCMHPFGIVINFPEDFEPEDPDYVYSCAGGDFNLNGRLDDGDRPYIYSITNALQVNGTYTGTLQVECADIDRDLIVTQSDIECLDLLSSGGVTSASQCDGCAADFATEICGDGKDNNCDGQTDRETYTTSKHVDYCACSAMTPCAMIQETSGILDPTVEANIKRCNSIEAGAYSWKSESQWNCTQAKDGQSLVCGGNTFTCENETMGGWEWLDGSGNVYPSTTTSGLNLVKEIELGVGETRRPLVAVTDDRVFVIYGERQENSWDFILKIYDKTLENELVSKTIIDGSELELGMPMDIRIGVQGDYLYLFHDAVSTEGHYLLGYKFTLDDAFEKVASPSTPLSSSVFWEDAKTGDELIDDPIVLPTQDKLFVITRYFGNIDKSADTIYKVYELTHDLEKIREFDLDLSSVSDGGARQANIREYNGNYYMSTSTLSTSEISGSRAAVDTLSPTDVLIVKLDTSWNILDSHIIVGEIEDDAESYLTAFGLDEKYYYFSYKHATFDGGTSFETPLKVYDKSYNIVTDITFAGSGRPQLVLADGLIYYALGIQTGGPQSSGIVVPSKLYVYELTE